MFPLKFDKKTIIILCVIAAIILLLLYFVMKGKSTNTPPAVAIKKGVGQIGTAITSIAYKPEIFPLAEYMQGADVKTLQTELNRRGATLTVDGYFGPATLASCMSILGYGSITQSQLTNLTTENISGNPVPLTSTTNSSTVPDVTTVNGMNQYIAILYNDLVNSTDIFGRDSSTDGGIYANLAGTPDQTLTNIFNAYTQTYGRDLGLDISNAYFSPNTTVDQTTISRLEDLDLTTA